MKTKQNNKYWQGCREIRSPVHCWRERQIEQLLSRQHRSPSQHLKWNDGMAQQSHFGCLPQRWKARAQTDTVTQVHSSIVPNSPTTCRLYTQWSVMLPLERTAYNLENRHRGTRAVILPRYWEQPNETENRMVATRGWEGGNREYLARVQDFSLRRWKCSRYKQPWSVLNANEWHTQG